MNSTEDNQPMGDYLDAPTFVAFTPGPGGHSCGDCGGDAPCPTIAILDKWGV